MLTHEEMHKEVMDGQKALAKQMEGIKMLQKQVLEGQKELEKKVKFCQDMVGDAHIQKLISDDEIERKRKADIEERDRQHEEIKNLIESLKPLYVD